MTKIMKVSEFRRRFRQVSVQVQDTECISASTNTAQFSQHHHHQSLKEMGREGSDEVQFSRVPGGVQEPRVHFRLRAHLASTPPTSRIARLTTPPSGSTFSSLPPALSLSEPPSLALNLPYIFVLFPGDVLKMGMPTYSFSVQTSHLTSMVEEGFDFNACIYNAMLVSPHLSFLVQERGLHSADLISFLVELSFHVNGEAYNINYIE
ncbi:uncharacterized protein [Malus domestica]|uniref:uncharacterized protein n=1 Tax=Malus domestica TaxID=3750 RepID=UPI003974A2DC